MKRWIMRIGLGLLFALPMMLVSAVWVQADSLKEADQPTQPECEDCHPAFQKAWEGSAHSKALTCDECHRELVDGKFEGSSASHQHGLLGGPEACLTCHTTGYDPETNTWQAEGITCAACHSPIPEKHPQEPMPVDRSANLCGKCHTETLFEWQASKHRQNDLACVSCHGPHSTDLKAGDPSALCATCHRTRASNFAHSAHSEEGLSCADCHLGSLNGQVGEGRAKRDHSFYVRLSTCNACHSYQMHDPIAVHPEQLTPTPEAELTEAEIEAFGANIEPKPANAFSFFLLSGLIGMAAGMVLAPWLERWYQRISQGDLRGRQDD